MKIAFIMFLRQLPTLFKLFIFIRMIFPPYFLVTLKTNFCEASKQVTAVDVVVWPQDHQRLQRPRLCRHYILEEVILTPLLVQFPVPVTELLYWMPRNLQLLPKLLTPHLICSYGIEIHRCLFIIIGKKHALEKSDQ